jgi:hypothetical protein
LPMGLLLGGFGIVDGVNHLGEAPTSGRNVSLALDGVAALAGALLVANGLWYLLAPEDEVVVYKDGER